MSNFPFSLDTDADLPRVDNNIDDIGADAINAIRDAMFRVEENIGIGANGTTDSIADRLNNFVSQDGTKILPSALAGVGLVTLPITDDQVSSVAEIKESKLHLNYSTSSLYNLYVTLKTSVDILNGFLSLTGIKLEPHISGFDYNHLLSAIHVDFLPVINKISQQTLPSAGTNVVTRNSTNAELLIKDLSDDLVIHQKSDSSASVSAATGGTVPPLNYGHNASGIYVDPSTFSTIPQVNNDVQKVIEYFDTSSLLLLGSRTQNLYCNGISRTSRSVSFLADGYGDPLVPPTPAIAYFLNVPPGPQASSPVDDFNKGDDIIEFSPTSQQLSTFNFDAAFAQVVPGDLLTINYGTGISYQFAVESIKSIVSGSNRTYAVRINGKNPVSNSTAVARIDKAVFHRNKFAVLSPARAPNSIGEYESLIVVNPRSALALGNGFNPSEFDVTHYNLYLALLPNGDITAPAVSLPAIDVTGDQGASPGSYTLDAIIDNINIAFRRPGYNFRFAAFQYQGQIGISLADPYNNASFSIISGTVDGYGNYTSSSNSSYPNNVVDNFAQIDPMAFGSNAANIASPPPAVSYANADAARFAPTLLFYPLKRNFFYTNGIERDTLESDPIILDHSQDSYGDGFWTASIINVNVKPLRVQVVYRIDLDLSMSGLKKGKTLVVQSLLLTGTASSSVNYGRFIIEDISFNNCGTSSAYTNITVYDAIHGTGTSPYASAPVGTAVKIYFSDDSVSFDAENVADDSALGPFKRFFEVYVDGNGHTFTHERARFSFTGSNITLINLYRVSPKLRGYLTSNNKSIRLQISSYDSATGIYVGQLGRWNSGSSTFTNLGPSTQGKKGEVIRFYDETNIDYIEFIFDIDDVISSFSAQTIDIQLFNSIQLNQQFMIVGSCQVKDASKSISHLKDERLFGNVSEEQFSTSAIDFITSGDRMLHTNGIIRGFDIASVSNEKITLDGGVAIVNGKVVNMNNETIAIPKIKELYSSTEYNINFALCVNSSNEFVSIPLTDYDSSFGTPNSDDRLFVALNPVNASTYTLDSSSFSNIVNSRKDLTILHVVSATVTGTGTSVVSVLSASDARKFINDGDSVTEITWTSDKAQGNFQSLAALNSWIKYNNTFNNIVKIRGTFDITSAITLNYPSMVEFTGDGAVFNISSAVGIILGKNVKLNRIKFNYLYTALGDGYYNSANLVNSINGLIYASTSSMENVEISDCEFTYSSLLAAVDRYPFISIESISTKSALRNINILRNIFNTYADSNNDDIRAAIAIINKVTSGDLTKDGPRLEKCNISGNLSNKSHMIIISSDLSSLNMLNALVPVSVSISDNVCGAICIGMRSDTATNFTNTNYQYDKLNALTISGNNCKYIASTSSTGKMDASVRIYTAPMLVKDNVCSWIHITANAATTALKDKKGSIKIVDNTLFAYDAAYIALYDDTVGNFAISVVQGNLANDVDVTCSRNNISAGEYIESDDITLITYNYLVGLYSELPSTITENVFNGLTGAAGCTFLRITSGSTNSSIVCNNKFYRNGTTITSYVDCQSVGSHLITDNFFDSSTIDGSSNVLAINVTPETVYERNKNQIKYAIIPLGGDNMSMKGGASGIISNAFPILISTDYFPDPTTDSGVASGYFFDKYTLHIYDTTGSPAQRFFSKTIDISRAIPASCKILDAQMGVFNPSIVPLDTAGTNTFALTLQTSRNHTNVIDVKTYTSINALTTLNNFIAEALLVINAGNEANMRAAVQVLEIDTTNFTGIYADDTGTHTATNLDVSSNYASGSDGNICASVVLNYKTTVATTTYGTPSVSLSPIVIKYTW